MSKKYRDQEWLREKYIIEGKDQQEIANCCSVTRSTVSEWINKLDINKRYKDEGWLKEKYCMEEKTIYDIADICNTTTPTIIRWLDNFGVERRSTTESKRIVHSDEKLQDEEWLRQQYIVNGKSLSEIGEARDVYPSTVKDWMKRHDIDRRRQGDPKPQGYEKLIDEDWIKDQYVVKEKSSYDIAEELGCTPPTVRNYMNFYGISLRDETEMWTDRFHEKIRDSSSNDGSRTHYGPGWEQKRQEIIERDGSCQLCGSDGGDYSLEVHHIEPLQFFEIDDEETRYNYDFEEANKKSNLILLCIHCHNNIPRGGIFVDSSPEEFVKLYKQQEVGG